LSTKEVKIQNVLSSIFKAEVPIEYHIIVRYLFYLRAETKFSSSDDVGFKDHGRQWKMIQVNLDTWQEVEVPSVEFDDPRSAFSFTLARYARGAKDHRAE
jgi:hypothetical protein